MSDPVVFIVRTDVVDAALAAFPDVLLGEMKPAISQAQMLLEREVSERTPTSGIGTLRESIGALPIEFGESVISGTVGTSSPYAIPVELGSRPHRPPVEPLAEWVGRKLGRKGKEGRRIAWAIAGKIARSGTPAHNMFSEGLRATQAQITQLLREAAGRATERLAP